MRNPFQAVPPAESSWLTFCFVDEIIDETKLRKALTVRAVQVRKAQRDRLQIVHTVVDAIVLFGRAFVGRVNVERALTEEKAFTWLLSQSTVTEAKA